MIGTLRAISTPAMPQPAVNARSAARPALPSSGAARSPPAPNSTVATSGAVTTTISTRRYCMKATSRASAPSSSLIATIPLAPPAIRPSSAVGRSRPVARESSSPATTEISSVATVTMAIGSQSPTTADSVSLVSCAPSATPITTWPKVSTRAGGFSGWASPNSERVGDADGECREQRRARDAHGRGGDRDHDGRGGDACPAAQQAEDTSGAPAFAA